MKKKASVHRLDGYAVTDPDRPAGDRWITMSNALTRAGHGLTLTEKRLIGMAASTLDSRRPPRSGVVVSTRIHAADYAALAGCALGTAYEQLQAASDRLFARQITFFTAAHNRDGRPLEPTRSRMRWVGAVRYQRGEGWVELDWWPSLLPHLVNLQRAFTSYQLQQATALRSIYTWRLMELLLRFRDTKWAEYTIEDFATSMDCTPKQRANFNNLRRRIIEPAVAELSGKDGWRIKWRPLKAGARVRAVRFEFDAPRRSQNAPPAASTLSPA